MSNKETAQDIFDAGIENGDSRDTIIVDMVKAGVSLNSATNWYKEMANDAGITTARVGHKKEALEYIGEQDVDLTDLDTRNELKAALREKFGVAASTANDYVKAYAEANGIELPTSSFGSNPEDQAKIYNWIVEHKDCTKEEFREFMSGEMGRSSGSIDETWRGIVLARKLAADGVEFSAAA
jgi:hypothetical protein